jgi:hypothetical protein
MGQATGGYEREIKEFQGSCQRTNWREIHKEICQLQLRKVQYHTYTLENDIRCEHF